MIARLSGVVCAGNLVADILVRPVEAIRFNTTTWVESIVQSLGGNGANTSYALAKLGVPVRLHGSVGADPFGDSLLAQLNEVGVDTRGVARCPEPTATTVALVNQEGARAFLHRPGVSREAFAQPVALSPPSESAGTHFHIANPFGLPRLRVTVADTLRRAKEAGWTTSLDTGYDSRGEWMNVVGPCLPHVDLFFANEDEVCRLTGCDDRDRGARTIRDAGAESVVVKAGPVGCVTFTAAGAQHHPGFLVDVVDTTGAGDCFVGGFLAALHRGHDLEQAARMANAVGALNVQCLGAVAGLRSWDETQVFIRSTSRGGAA